MWYLLLDASGNILKKYPDPMAAREKDRPNLVKTYEWPLDKDGQPLPKSVCKLTKTKKKIKNADGIDIDVDGDVTASVKGIQA